jgi:hypothetical protein
VLTLGEIFRSVYGAWRLAHADPAGMRFFDATPEGFWRSFQVAVLIAPLYALLVLLDYAGPPPDPDAAPIIASAAELAIVELIAYAISWMAFPLAAHFLVTALDRERDYIGFIVAYNWASVLQIGVLLPVAVIGAGEALPAEVGAIVSVAASLALLAYSWFIAKTALRVTGLIAAGIVAMDVLISILLATVKHMMVH